jgi:hypothetical protein
LLRFVLLLDLAAIAFGAVVLRVVLLHLARITTTIRMILAAFRFHLARIATATTPSFFCFGISRALFHRTRTTVATTRRHRATSFALLLITLSGGLRDGRCKGRQHQRKEHYQDSVLSGFHFSSPGLKDYLPRTGEHTGTLLEDKQSLHEQADL